MLPITPDILQKMPLNICGALLEALSYFEQNQSIKYLHKVEISQIYANSEAERGSAAAGSAPQTIPACFARRIARVP